MADVEDIVGDTIYDAIDDNVLCILLDKDPFAKQAYAAYIYEMEEAEDYPDLVDKASRHYERLFGIEE